MNYYEHHIGDYDEATSHLTACEDGIYSRLIRKYMAKEEALPNDLPALQRLVRARTREEKKAVATVLSEFFILVGDVWHQHTCDEAIEKFRAGEPERELKKANEDNRLKRHREERAKLFKALTEAGLHAPWNTGMSELREMVAKLSATPPEAVPATAPETQLQPLPATAPATPATATQSPLPTTQTPVLKPSKPSEVVVDLRAQASNADLVPTTALDWVRFFADEHGIQTDTYSAKGREKFWPLAQGWIDAKISIGKMRETCAKAKEDATEPIMYLPSYVNSVLINAQSRAAQPPKQKPLHRMTDNELLAEATRVKADSYKCSRDELIDRITNKRKQLEGVAA